MLSSKDVAALLSDPSPEARAATAEKIAKQFGLENLSEQERSIAEDIFRVMVKDAQVRVREALAESLKDNPSIPYDVAKSLANDVESVSLPVLQFSDVLTDEDLIEIVRSQGADKQMAIAQRKSVSEGLSDALVDSGDESVVATLVSNEGAQIAEPSLQKVVDNFGHSDAVQGAMVSRPALPATVIERLVTRLSAHYQAELASRHDLSDHMASDLFLAGRERAVLGIGADSTDEQLIRMVLQMDRTGRLTPSIMVRALCMGDLRFFEFSMSRLAEIPLENARLLIHDDGLLGLQGICRKAELPERFYPAVKAAIEAMRQTSLDGGERDRERYARRIIERVLTHYDDLGVQFESDDLEYLLTKMNELPSDQSLGTGTDG
ncbi:DUF2336 domain-containing protein [Magnetospira sp. QH-2]|uniref:DUF2336 domain-containing protein n=1 Tax=Magnetospira sp. (strain QH-2) TaxID=1288970 RepID=UPI0003E812EB|nr:DUF2336 domain-containing protein [Magnetospira sp. QH-2]CCQ73909.1 Conserved protein of unknown function [Magnetospira sp. QH-2]